MKNVFWIFPILGIIFGLSVLSYQSYKFFAPRYMAIEPRNIVSPFALK